ncbi:hypothetical protein BDZ94DRAFT_575747 [Collybia nuda]|uniref:Uncharacterized protein n=1 Tax=Collybia nuda TaxID=64659 RepID=A0A9P5Y8U2_9AGAR|nr:hypothetical protein BDZ94DRAFT_575747 [Collybia nuda]
MHLAGITNTPKRALFGPPPFGRCQYVMAGIVVFFPLRKPLNTTCVGAQLKGEPVANINCGRHYYQLKFSHHPTTDLLFFKMMLGGVRQLSCVKVLRDMKNMYRCIYGGFASPTSTSPQSMVFYRILKQHGCFSGKLTRTPPSRTPDVRHT